MKTIGRTPISQEPDLGYESQLWEKGLRFVAGVDEAGRGALAGPVSAGVVMYPPELDVQQHLTGMYDSKKLTAHAREGFASKIIEVALAFSVGFSSAQEIDQLGILPATQQAVIRALAKLSLAPEYILIDYISLPDSNYPQMSIVKGDEKSLSIAGASILAKVARDDLMRQLDLLHPGYGFAGHKGYGTARHQEAIALLGPCPEHRLSFRLPGSDH